MIGETVAHYKILGQLGTGGMGVVYRAEDTKLHRTVALKFLPPDIAADERAVERFKREARAAAALNHPNICTIHEIGEHDGQPFIVMELLEGRTLKERLEAGSLSVDDLLEMGTQIADALDAAHQKGMVHRDIKPANIFLTHAGSVKVLDFGLVKTVAGPAEASTLDERATVDDMELTRAGSAVGTVAYMSPEQVRGEELDARSDLFSFGLVLYEMATGRQPFSGSTSGVVFEAILNRAPTAPAHLNPDVPPQLEAIINKALEKRADLRYQHASDIRSDIKRLRRDTDSGLSSATTSVPAYPSGARSGSKVAMGIVAVAVVLLAVIFIVAFQLGGGSALEESDLILLTDFENTTGEPVFDDTLKQALAVKLAESPFLNVVADQRVRETLRFMDRSPDERVTPDIGREICEREGIKAMMTGQIVPLGSSFVITLTALNCATGETIAAEQVQAESAEQVLSVLGQAAVNIRGQLGESLPMIESFNTPIEATTSSLDALKAFSLAEAQRAMGRDQESAPFYRRALEFDPEFAVAYARLGTVLNNMDDHEAAIENYRKAFELRERASERERFYLTAHYHATVEGDTDKAIETYNLWRETYPRDSTPPTNLANIYSRRRQWEQVVEWARISLELEAHPIPYGQLVNAYQNLGKGDEALETLEEWMEEFPEDGTPHSRMAQYRVQRGQFEEALETAEIAYRNERTSEHLEPLVEANLGLNRVSEARSLAEQAVEDNPENVRWRLWVYGMAEIHGDREVADAQVEWARGKPTEHLMIGMRATIVGMLGRVEEATALYEQALAVPVEQGRVFVLTDVAGVYLMAGYKDRAREATREALAENAAASKLAVAGLLALLGENDEAEALVQEIAEGSPSDEVLNEATLPAIEALIAVNRDEPDRALELLEDEHEFERAELPVPYVRGLAYARADRPDEALAEFRKILDNPGAAYLSVGNGMINMMASIETARLLAREGRNAEAAATYEEIFDYWKDADADLPTLLELRSEYANLS